MRKNLWSTKNLLMLITFIFALQFGVIYSSAAGQNLGKFLVKGKVMQKGQYLKNGVYKLAFQKDGNFVLYRGTKPLWALQTFGLPYNSASKVTFQKDGNFCVYNAKKTCILATMTNNTQAAALMLGTDGRLYMFYNNLRITRIQKLYSFNKVHSIKRWSLY